LRQLVYYTTAARNRQALFTKKFIFFCSNYLSNHVELFFLHFSPP
jgi:hypothetical protein